MTDALTEALNEERRILGDAHLDPISTIGQRQPEEAAKLQLDAYEKLSQIQGTAHPDTVKVADRLANTLEQRGDLAGAARVQREVLAGREKLFGQDHPDAIKSLRRLASILGKESDNIHEVINLQRQVVDRCKHTFGHAHDETMSALQDLAESLEEQAPRDLEEPIALYYEMLQNAENIDYIEIGVCEMHRLERFHKDDLEDRPKGETRHS